MNGFYQANNFVSNVYKELNSLQSNKFYSQKGIIKQLKEEKLPLACFVKKLERPGLSVKCKHISGSQNFDAKLKLFGYFVDQKVFKNDYFIEITNAVYNEEHKARIALANYGYYSDGKLFNTDDPTNQMILKIQDAIDKKHAKKYPENTILLVNLIPSKPLIIRNWEKIRNEIKINDSNFLNILMVEPYSNVVLEVFVNKKKGSQSFT